MFVTTLVVLAILLVSACGGGEEASQPTTPGPSPTDSPISATPTVTVGPATPVGMPEAGLPMGKLAFSSRRDGDGEIYLLSDKGEINLTNDPGEDIESDLSPDGEKVVFASNRDGIYHVYVVNVDGAGLIKLTDDSAGDLSPRWSPDGKRIAFSRTGALYVMDSDGSNVQKVTEPESEATAPLCKAGAFLGGWSPDGQQLIFYAASVTRGLGQVCTVNVDGSDLTVVVSEPPGYNVEPIWAPDGEWIAYRSIREGNHEIYIVKPDGTEDTNLTNHPAIDLEPDWSPDSQWVVFGSIRTGDFDLYIVKTDGSDLARVTTAIGKDSDPSWGP